MVKMNETKICDRCHIDDVVMGEFQPNGGLLMFARYTESMNLCKRCHDDLRGSMFYFISPLFMFLILNYGMF